MKLNREQLEKVNEVLEFIIDFCPYFIEFYSDLIYSEASIKEIVENEESIEEIELSFPGDNDLIEIPVGDLLTQADEIMSIKIINKGLVKTDLRRFYLVEAKSTEEDYIIRKYHNLEMTTREGIKLNLIGESLILGMAATNLEEYDDNFWGTANQYLAIEISYVDISSALQENEEFELLKSYIFEIADSTGIALKLSEIRNPVDDFIEIEEEVEENSTEKLRELEAYNEGMRLFVSAVQIEEPELKFLNFYKILEHFSPIAVNVEANELMRKKLDAPKRSFENGDYIRSIFDLANSLRDKFKDEDLIKSSFNSCFDFIGLFNELPDSLKKTIKKQTNLSELNYSTDKQKITTACNIAGKIIYKTRNKVVHAKSNFKLSGDEITSSEFDQLNVFMKEASSQAIRWYARQPKHLKLDIIN